jgi:acyl-CoA synthetase (AMP-forming)/AMP-acid ligase II
MTGRWSKDIVTETIGGVPFRVYADRPRRISDILPLAAAWGDRIYLAQGDRSVSFARLLDASAAKADALIAAGVAPGDRVLLLGWNSPDWALNFWAIARIGAVPVLANAWWSADDIAHAIASLRPRLVLADARAAGNLPAGCPLGAWAVDEHAVAKFPPAPLGATDENAPAAIIFTSGTEGRAKAVVLAHRSLLSNQMMLLHATRRLPYHPDPASGEVCLHTGPLFHIGGIGALLRGVLACNTLIFPTGRYDPAEALALIERHRISRWNAVPTMASRLLDCPDLVLRDTASLRSLTLGGAPVHAELLRRIRESLPSVSARIATGYGLSENAGQATAAGGADIIARPGSAGRPLPLVELRIAERRGAADGEVLVRSPTQMLGYFGEETSPIDPEGWLHTGDLGRIEADGHLWITGRLKDLVIRGGENIAPAAVERALMEIPGVAEAAVFGVPHPDLGEEVMAVVVTDQPLTPAGLTEILRGRLASFAIPTRWVARDEPLPVNLTGKVDKPALRSRYLGASEARS